MGILSLLLPREPKATQKQFFWVMGHHTYIENELRLKIQKLVATGCLWSAVILVASTLRLRGHFYQGIAVAVAAGLFGAAAGVQVGPAVQSSAPHP